MRLAPDKTDDNLKNSSSCTDCDSEMTPFYNLDSSSSTVKADDIEHNSLYRHDAFISDQALFEGNIEIKLNRRSLYILSGPLRYTFSHEIFGSKSKPQLFPDDVSHARRLSVIFRDELPPH